MMWQMCNFDWEQFMDGCCAKDFGNFRDEHIWVYDHQPKNEALADHGYVHVSHKQYFCTQGDETTSEYKPAVVWRLGITREQPPLWSTQETRSS